MNMQKKNKPKKNTLSRFTIEQLLEELQSRKNVSNEIDYISKKVLKQAGFSTKDILVDYFKDSYDDEYRYMFHLMVNNKKQDFYYGSSPLNYFELCDFLPPIFAEASENEFESNENLTKTKEILLKCGFEEKNIKEIQNPD